MFFGAGGSMRQRLLDSVEFWRFLCQRFSVDRAPQSAASLTFTTLFAVVPLLTVTFVMLSAIPALQGVGEQIQRFILENFLPDSGDVVHEHLTAFTTQARQLTWIGVLFLLATAYTMLVSVEKAFNHIWRVRQPRRGVARFLLYWAVLSLGPLLLGAGFVASTYVTSLSLLSGPGTLMGAKPLLHVTPILSCVAAFTLFYAVVPNTRVPLRYALVGGLFAAALFEVAKALFGFYVRLFPGYQLIYGAFATVPLFLLWIYLSWLIVLFGAELVCNLPSSQRWRKRKLPRFIVLLGVLRQFYLAQQSGERLSLRKLRARGWPLPEDEWDELLDFLEGARLVCPANNGGWLLCRDLNQYRMEQLLERLPWPLPSAAQLPKDFDEPWYPSLKKALEALTAQRSELFSNNLAHWLQAS